MLPHQFLSSLYSLTVIIVTNEKCVCNADMAAVNIVL